MRISSYLSRNIPTDFLFLICGVAVVCYAAIGTIDISTTGLGLAYFAFVSCYSFCSSYFATIPWSRSKYFLGFAAIALGLTLFVAFVSQPAHGQLFKQTADAICNSLSSAATGVGTGTASDSGVEAAKTMVKSLMWVLRALIILFILFAVFQIVQNRDDQQKMQEIARTPIMIVFGTIIVDVLSSFVGAAAASGGCG